MKIYTKTGDGGSSSLIGGTKVPKDDIRLEAYGSIDELNSFLGLLIIEDLEPEDSKLLITISNQLFKIGSYLATDQAVVNPEYLHPVSDEMIGNIEQAIDKIYEILPEVHEFVLPVGTRTSSLCHVCRTICRRAERLTVKVSRTYTTDSHIIMYLNRLSDYLFALSRKTCLAGGKEIFWDKSK